MKPFTLVGVDGNAFSVMYYTKNAMRAAGMSAAERDVYQSMAMSGDYNNLICISCDMIDKANELLREQGKIESWEDDEDEY